MNWTRYGIGARWQHKAWDVYGTYIVDTIDQPDFGNTVVNTAVWETQGSGLSVEADYLLTSKWLIGTRLDYMAPGGLSVLPAPFVTPGDQKINQEAAFIGLIGKYYPRPNIAFYGRAHYNLLSSAQLPTQVFGSIEHPARNLTYMVTVGVDMAF